MKCNLSESRDENELPIRFDGQETFQSDSYHNLGYIRQNNGVVGEDM